MRGLGEPPPFPETWDTPVLHAGQVCLGDVAGGLSQALSQPLVSRGY